MENITVQDIYNVLLFAALIITVSINIRGLAGGSKKEQQAVADERADTKSKLASLEKTVEEIRKAVTGPPPISQDIEIIKNQLTNMNCRLERLEKREEQS